MSSTTIDRLDGLSSSAAIKGPCRVATTGNIALYGLQTIDGVVVASGDRVLVKDQEAAWQNGIYIVDTGPWRRSRDFNQTRDVVRGTLVVVTSGAAQAGFQFAVDTDGAISIGTTNIVFAIQVNSASGVRFETIALASAANISDDIHAVTLEGYISLGDGRGGLYVDTNNGSNDTFVSADGRTWYRVGDVGAGRLNRDLMIGLQKSKDTPFNPSFIKNNVGLSGTFGVKLKNPALTNVRGQQGMTWAEHQSCFYSTWTRSNSDGSERVNVVRHDGDGNVIDYGATVGPSSGNPGICFDHGQDIEWFTDVAENLFLVTDGGGALGATSRGASIFEYQQSGSIGPDADGWDIIVAAGQSNMAGVSTGSVPSALLDASDPSIYELRSGSSSPTVAVAPLGHPTSNANGYGPGPELEFAKAYKARKLRSNRRVLILPVAVSSTGVTESGPWAVGGAAYNNMLAQISAAIALPGNNRVVALLWSQGETDSNRSQVGGTSATTQEYRNAFHPVIDGFRASTPSAAYAPIVIMGMEPAWVSAQAYRQPVQAALESVPTFKKWTAYSAGPSGYAASVGDLHFNAAGNRLRGRNAFTAWLSAVDNTMGTAGTPAVIKDLILQPPGVTSGTVFLSTDKKYLVKTGGPLPGGKKNIRIFDLATLLAGPSGDRQADCIWEMEQPDFGGLPNQTGYMHDGRLYMLNGTQALNFKSRLTTIDIASKTVVGDPMFIDTGLDQASQQNNGAGAKNEPEGGFVVRPQAGGPLQFWVAIGQDNADGSGLSTFAFPIFQRDFGAAPLNGNRSPLRIAANLAGGGHKIGHPRSERMTISSYENTLEGTIVKNYLALDPSSTTVVAQFIREDDGTTEHKVLDYDRVSGGVNFAAAPLKVGTAADALGVAGAVLNAAGRWLMSLASAGANHFLFRSNTANAGSIRSTGAITDYILTSGGVGLTAFAGNPENNVSAPPGMMCIDVTNRQLYIKDTGTAATGWKLFTRAA